MSFTADRTNPVNGSHTWLLGGSAELGVNGWKGVGIAAKVTGLTSSAFGSQGTPLNLVVTTFGPRYRFQPKHSYRTASVYGEGLIGEANGFRGLFPSRSGVQSNSSTMALQVGGGIDCSLNSRLMIRAVEASWLRTQFANSTTNVQNNLIVGSGLALRF